MAARERGTRGRREEVVILMAGTQLIDDDENGSEEEKPKPHRGDVRKREVGGRGAGGAAGTWKC